MVSDVIFIDELKEELERLYGDSMDVVALSPNEVLDIASGIKQEIVARAKVHKNRPKKIDDGTLIALWEAGRTINWIAEELNVNKSSVSRKLKKLREEGRVSRNV